jgi:hypothetical protein
MEKRIKTIRSFFFVVMIMGSGCSKPASTPIGPPPPPPCTTGFCQLTGAKWIITSQTIDTDLGLFTYTTNQVSGINWGTFTFKRDSTYQTDAGGKGTYSYMESSKAMVLLTNLLPIDFAVSFPTSSSLALKGDTIRMHPRIDPGVSANFSINSIVPALHDDFGVDTSKIHFFQTTFYYRGL